MVNPILTGFSPDPSICRVDGEYLVATSSMEYVPAIPLHASTDGTHWEPIGHAIDRPDQLDLSDCGDSYGVWAPTIRHHEGVWYLAATVMTDGASRGRSFYLTAGDPRGDWSDPVWLPDADGIDPSLFFHGGRVWWLGSRTPAEPEWPDQREIWLRELDLQAQALIGPTHVLWNGALRGARWTEAPHLYRHDGRFVLITAEGGTGREHAVVVARADDLLGPYEGSHSNPVLTHRHLGEAHPVQNVGHADLVTRPDGSSRAVVLGARTQDGHHLLGRETFAVDVDWQDGWPVFNPGVGRLSGGTDVPTAIGENTPTLQGWTAVRRAPGFAAQSSDGLVLTAPDADDAPAALLRPLRALRTRVGVRLEPGTDSVGGLILRQNTANSVGIEVARAERSSVAHLVRRRDGVERRVPLPASLGREVSLGVDLHGLLARFTLDGVEVHAEDVRYLSTESSGGFGGVLFGPYVAGPTGGAVTMTAWWDEPLAD